MGKLEKCLYIVELLSRGKSLSLKEINEHWEYSSLYDGEIIPKTFGRYKDYISNVFAIDIEYDVHSKNEAGLTRKFETSHVGGATGRTPPIPRSALEKDPDRKSVV